MLAMAAGTVVWATGNGETSCPKDVQGHEIGGFGCRAAIQHDDGGTVVVYAHLLDGSVKVKRGEHVMQGSVSR